MPDGLVGIDGREDIVQGIAINSREDYQIVDVAGFHAVVDDDAFHDKQSINAQHIKAFLGNRHLGVKFSSGRQEVGTGKHRSLGQPDYGLPQ